MVSILLLVFFIGLLNIAQASWPSPRAYTECVYVWPEATIYCLGGDIEPCGDKNNTSTKDKGDDSNNGGNYDLQSTCRKSTETFYSLYINQDSDFNRLQNSWEVVKSDISVSKHFTMSAVIERTRNYIVINGGYIGNNSIHEEYTTGIYDTSLGFWETQDKATDVNGDHPLIYGHAATVSSNGSFIYTSGGIINSDEEFGANTSFSLSVSLPANNLNIFDAKESVWRFVPRPNPEFDEYVRQFHKAVLGNDDIIYFIGGYAPVGREYNEGYFLYSLSMDRMTTYDTKVGRWSVTDINSDSFYPLKRIHHSATLLPSKNEILVFGGIDTYTGEALQETIFCIFDIKSMTWNGQALDQEDPNDNNSAITKGHYGHSAIVAEPYLFIMFGFDHNNRATNSTWVIDTRSWKWVSSISKVEPAPPSKGADDKDNNNENYIPDDDNSHNIDGFVIATIAVAACFGVVLICLAARLYSRRKRRNQSNSAALPMEADESSAALHNNNRDGLDNVMEDDHNSIASITDSLPPYRLHDNGHQLPRINATDDTTTRYHP